MERAMLYIMCGLPFSGKSLFSEEVEEKTSIVRVSFDDVWREMCVKIPDNTYEAVISYVEQLIMSHLQKGVSVIYDSTNLKAETRQSLLYLAERCGARGVIIYLPTNKEETRVRREKSMVDGSHHTIDTESIEKAFERLEVPAECVTLVTDEDKQRFVEGLCSR